jgi:hypothetical protein
MVTSKNGRFRQRTLIFASDIEEILTDYGRVELNKIAQRNGCNYRSILFMLARNANMSMKKRVSVEESIMDMISILQRYNSI